MAQFLVLEQENKDKKGMMEKSQLSEDKWVDDSNSIDHQKQLESTIPGSVDMAPSCMSSIVSLCVSSNKICDRGATAIAGVLNHTMLTELDLSWNQITNNGANALSAGAFFHLSHTSFTSLSLTSQSSYTSHTSLSLDEPHQHHQDPGPVLEQYRL